MSSKLRCGAVCVLGGLVLALGAAAEEVEVKNDSFTSGGSLWVVGDWIPGERAAARLTAPCDGAIVAVQVVWRSFFGGSTPHLSNGIRIYEGATFPTPGAELEFLEGALFQDGFLNEFRYIDENQTIPLSVPIAGGQQFYVAVEFGEPVGILQGDGSVTRDVDGCQAGKNAIFALPGGWQDFCSFTSGDFIIRAVVDCAEPAGACCMPTGVCVDGVEQADCLGFGWVWTGGASCAQVSCGRRGACCLGTGCLTLVSPQGCSGAGGVYAGDGSNCVDGVCAKGACCSLTGQCTLVIQSQCAGPGQSWLGAGTSCNPNPCPQPSGACCIGTFCFAGQFEPDCVGAGGAWQGAGSDCDPDPCQVPGCRGDMDCDGLRNFADIDPFVLALQGQSAYAAQYPNCAWLNGDINDDAAVNFADIDAFVATLGTVCP